MPDEPAVRIVKVRAAEGILRIGSDTLSVPSRWQHHDAR